MPSVYAPLPEKFADVRFLLGALRRTRRRDLIARLRSAGGVAALRVRAEETGDPLHGADETVPYLPALEKLAKRGDVRVAFLGEAGYPRLLDHSADPPVLLFVRSGSADLELPGGDPAVAIVGSRAATTSGRQVAERFGRELAAAGASVVSGMARGIDSAAHRGALAAGGTTIAVLGCGLDVDYPKENRELADEIAGSGGAVLTELPPGTPPLPEHFPERNRIVAGLCEAIVVVEARERSGSLITARLGLEENREIFGVPGSTLGDSHVGVHRLLREGARLAASAADLLADLRPGQLPLFAPSKPIADLPAWLREALSAEEPRSTDDLSNLTGKSIPELLVVLLEAELSGAVRTAPGGRYLLRV